MDQFLDEYGDEGAAVNLFDGAEQPTEVNQPLVQEPPGVDSEDACKASVCCIC